MTSPIETTLFDLLAKVAPGKSIAPEDVAKLVEPELWRRKLGEVRNTAIGLARQGKLVITRHGKPADPDAFKGVYRLRLPLEGDVVERETADDKLDHEHEADGDEGEGGTFTETVAADEIGKDETLG